jgi:hypothetical protein
MMHDVIIGKTWMKQYRVLIDTVRERVLFTSNYCDHLEGPTEWLPKYKRQEQGPKKDIEVAKLLGQFRILILENGQKPPQIRKILRRFEENIDKS